MAQIMKHRGGRAGAGAYSTAYVDDEETAVAKFMQVAIEASSEGDAVRLLSVVAETAADAVRQDPIFYAFDLILTVALMFLIVKGLRRLFS